MLNDSIAALSGFVSRGGCRIALPVYSAYLALMLPMRNRPRTSERRIRY